LEILGAGSGNAAASPEIWIEAVRQLMSNVACGALRIDTERVPLNEVEKACNGNSKAEERSSSRSWMGATGKDF